MFLLLTTHHFEKVWLIHNHHSFLLIPLVLYCLCLRLSVCQKVPFCYSAPYSIVSHLLFVLPFVHMPLSRNIVCIHLQALSIFSFCSYVTSPYLLYILTATDYKCVHLTIYFPVEHPLPSCQNATAPAAATLSESTPCAIGIITV